MGAKVVWGLHPANGAAGSPRRVLIATTRHHFTNLQPHVRQFTRAGSSWANSQHTAPYNRRPCKTTYRHPCRAKSDLASTRVRQQPGQLTPASCKVNARLAVHSLVQTLKWAAEQGRAMLCSAPSSPSIHGKARPRPRTYNPGAGTGAHQVPTVGVQGRTVAGTQNCKATGGPVAALCAPSSEAAWRAQAANTPGQGTCSHTPLQYPQAKPAQRRNGFPASS